MQMFQRCVPLRFYLLQLGPQLLVFGPQLWDQGAMRRRNRGTKSANCFAIPVVWVNVRASNAVWLVLWLVCPARPRQAGPCAAVIVFGAVLAHTTHPLNRFSSSSSASAVVALPQLGQNCGKISSSPHGKYSPHLEHLCPNSSTVHSAVQASRSMWAGGMRMAPNLRNT